MSVDVTTAAAVAAAGRDDDDDDDDIADASVTDVSLVIFTSRFRAFDQVRRRPAAINRFAS